MAQPRNPYLDSTEPGYGDNGMTGLPAPPQAGPQPPAAGGAPPPAAAPPRAAQPFDRTGFRDAWMGSSGSMDSFLQQHPEFQGVTATNSKNGTYQLPSGELMDLQIAKGANGDNAQHGWTGVGEVHNGAASYYPPAGGAGAPNAGASGGAASSSAAGGPANFASIMSVLQGLYPNGAFNQGVVNQRTEATAENMNRFRKSQQATDRSQMAARGLLGSGAEQTAQNRLDQNIADQYSGAVENINANESQQADQRMMQALGLASNMTTAQAQQAIDWFNANTGRENAANQLQLGLGGLDLNRTLGLGNLAVANTKNTNDYNLGVANYGLNRDQLVYALQNGDIDRVIAILNGQGNGAQISANGMVG
jgi:hypothetical protein